jgi:hypothetical protein
MKHLYRLLSACFVLLWGAVGLHAQTPWDGSTSAITPSGTTYSVSTAAELAWIAEQSQTTDFAGYTIELTADLDLGGTLEPAKKWLPIGCAANPFNGDFNGNNHVIRNLYISGNYTSVGLFAETGTAATIHHLAIAQGQIFTDGINDVGCLVGIHRGTIHHCFNMAQILANNGNRVGGLVGTNEGAISYSYNTGLITKANSIVGGLVGSNTATATLDWCYNTGYCSGAGTIGSLIGQNAAAADKITNVYFDQQVTRMDAVGNSSTVLDNATFAVVKTTEMKEKFELETAEWVCPENNAYPKLVCFGDLPAAQLSTYGIWLDADNMPMERAEAVGTPKEGNKPRKTFGLDHADAIQWVSGNESVIHIKNSSTAETFRPCGNQEVLLTVSLGNDKKQIYTYVRGYETFDPGEIGGEGKACWQEGNFKFSTINSGKAPSGGKDDEQEAPTDYQYLVIRYAVTYDTDSNKIYTLLDTIYEGGQKGYNSLVLNTNETGEYAYKRYTHDYQCTTTWTESPGYSYLKVLDKFEAGSLYEKIDTIYGLPKDTVVLSEEDASGGGGKFTYAWAMNQTIVDYVTGETQQGKKQTTIYDDNTGEPISTATCPIHFTEPGEYTYDRRVKEQSCQNSFLQSTNSHTFVVFDSLRAGTIMHIEEKVCTPELTDTILEVAPATGGNGRYSYRWLCNGEVIPNSDTVALDLGTVTMTDGQAYVFRRQVKDDTGLMDWTTSNDSVYFTIYAAYKAGAVRHSENRKCYTHQDELTLPIQVTEQTAPQGDGDFIYCWLIYRAGENTPLDTIHQDEASLNITLQLNSFSGLRLPATLVIRRAVKNTLCPSAWQLSTDSVVWHTGYEEVREEVVSPCAAELPYRDTYQYQDGHTQQYSLADGASVTFNDQTPDGCPLTRTITCRAYKRPKVEVQPIVSVCQTDTALVLIYTIEEGNPNAYDVTFSAEAEAAGFVSRRGESLPSSGHEIRVPMPTNAPLGKYSFTVLFYTASTSGTAGCVGEVQSLSFSLDMDGYVHRKWNDVVFVDNSDKNCEPNCDDDLTFVAYQWYKDGEPIPGATEQSYYEEGGLNGYYQVLMTAEDGTVYRSCEYEMRPITALNEVNAPLHLYPIPTLAGSMMQIQAEESGTLYFYNLQGVCCGQHTVEIGTRTIHAPAVSGIYLARFVSANEHLFTCKLIVL